MKPFSEVYDVCVVGGGFAGFGAALKSAKLGMETILVEKCSAWGGVSYSSIHQSICGLYPYSAGCPEETLNDGISRDLEEGMKKNGWAQMQKVGNVYVLGFESEALQRYFKEQVQFQKNLKVVFNAKVIKVHPSNQVIEKLSIEHLQNIHTIRCHTVIDASGKGEVLYLSGASYDVDPATKRQLAAYVIKIKGVQKTLRLNQLKVFYYLAKAVKSGVLDNHLRFGSWITNNKSDEGVLRISVIPRDTKYCLEEIQSQAQLIHNLLKKEIEEFKNSKIVYFAPSVSEREGIRMIGLYVLSEEDVLSGRKFDDGVVKGAWPIEFWHQSQGPRYRYLPRDQYYEIPMRCLISKDFLNLFAAGRCISVSSRALASTRVTGTCLALGEASAKIAFSYLNR
jgi:flavin-dependent dehydrogenase